MCIAITFCVFSMAAFNLYYNSDQQVRIRPVILHNETNYVCIAVNKATGVAIAASSICIFSFLRF